ncbi:hypothetical protein BDP27DRAFT_391082 [Rhodocollybia butyracea]|uniref:Uncharacterized protein n=1 Tax=Rhodocollybia butyracea TaxID=206335 RepID=A0A9P5UC55_9AGAR|nr:hypothetical protein BDP27DRAFT_391082 [Rhodocollybia butyracea]
MIMYQRRLNPSSTAHITLALGVSGPITYNGRYPPDSEPRFFFKLIGGHPYCLPDDPCHGFVQEPNGAGEYSLPDLIFVAFLISCHKAHTLTKTKDIYSFISQKYEAWTSKGPKGMTLLGHGLSNLEPLELGLDKMHLLATFELKAGTSV